MSALTYGPFSVTPDQAVKDSYILNTAQAAIDRSPDDKLEIGQILADYCDGNRSFEQTIEALNEDLE